MLHYNWCRCCNWCCYYNWCRCCNWCCYYNWCRCCNRCYYNWCRCCNRCYYNWPENPDTFVNPANVEFGHAGPNYTYTRASAAAQVPVLEAYLRNTPEGSYAEYYKSWLKNYDKAYNPERQEGIVGDKYVSFDYTTYPPTKVETGPDSDELKRIGDTRENERTPEDVEKLNALRKITPLTLDDGTTLSATDAKARYDQIATKREDTITDDDRAFAKQFRAQYGFVPIPDNANVGSPEIVDRTTAMMEGLTQDGQPILTEGMTVDAFGVSQDAAQDVTAGVGQIAGDVTASAFGAKSTGATAPASLTANVFTANQVSDAVRSELTMFDPAQGTLSEEAKAIAANLPPQELAQLGLSPAQLNKIRQVSEVTTAFTESQAPDAATRGSTPQANAATFEGGVPTADAAIFEGQTPQATAQDQFSLTPTQAATQAETQAEAAAKASEIPSAEAIQSTYRSTLTAAQGRVGSNELVDARAQGLQIDEPVTAIAAVMENLNSSAVAKAQQGSFSQLLAQPAQGTVEAKATVQGQIATLMDQFNNGSTPVWAAGAMRAANAAMASRGLGGSSMASAAIIQATMEVAIPIAQQDAQTFNNMGLSNLANRQQVAITNAAAQQNIELSNLNNRQQTALQNSANAFSLQSQNLSNGQAVVLSNAQIAAAAQNKNLDVRTQTSLVNAARFAEVNNINLSNRQQANLQRSSENLQVNLTNLSEANKTALANLQVRAALIGQELSNEQQVSILESTQTFQRANFDASSKQQSFIQDAQAKLALEGKSMDIRQQTSLFNVTGQLDERKLDLTNEQQTRLFNTTNALNIDIQDLSNRQQTALANAQINASLEGQELNNRQQSNVIRAARIAEVANLNFSAEQQRVIENAKLAQTVDLSNLSNRQAKVMADAAALTQLDVTNLNARQQSNIQNAQAFLQMDTQNLTNRQQKTMLDSQSMVQSMLSDQAALNANKQFNATSQNQTDQFFESLSAQVSQFNSNQQTQTSQFNAGQLNAVSQFNANVKNQREQFNAQNAVVIAQSNAQWRRQIATADTAALNRANELNARSTLELSTLAYNNTWQLYKDIFEFAFQAEEGRLDRENALSRAEISADAGGGSGSAFGSIAGSIVGGITSSIFSDIRLKKNIEPVLDYGNGIKMYKWEWRDNAKGLPINKRQNRGFIAQNVLKYFPDLVRKDEEAGYLRVDYLGVVKKCMA